MKRIIKKGFGYLIILFILLAITLSPMIVIDKQLQENEQQEEIPLQNAVQNNDLLAKAKVKKTTKKKTTKKKKTVKKQAKKYVKANVRKAKVTGTKAQYQAYAHDLVIKYGWSEYDFECLVKIVNHESGWNVNSINKSSGACGLFQALPCSKMASVGSDYRTNYKTQTIWGLQYIKNRYGTPAKAWTFWQKHHWY